MRQVANTIQFNLAIVLRHVDERDSLFTSGAWLKKKESQIDFEKNNLTSCWHLAGHSSNLKDQFTDAICLINIYLKAHLTRIKKTIARRQCLDFFPWYLLKCKACISTCFLRGFTLMQDKTERKKPIQLNILQSYKTKFKIFGKPSVSLILLWILCPRVL